MVTQKQRLAAAGGVIAIAGAPLLHYGTLGAVAALGAGIVAYTSADDLEKVKNSWLPPKKEVATNEEQQPQAPKTPVQVRREDIANLPREKQPLMYRILHGRRDEEEEALIVQQQFVSLAPPIARRTLPPMHTEEKTEAVTEQLPSVETTKLPEEKVTDRLPELSTMKLPDEQNRAPFQSKHPTAMLFDQTERAQTQRTGPRRFTVEELTSRIKHNSMDLYVGRSLTGVNHPPVKINIADQHIKVVGSTQKGKSSFVAGILKQLTETHDPSRLLVALLDMENKTSRLFADTPLMAGAIMEDGSTLTLHAKDKESVAEHLGVIVDIMNQRYELEEYQIAELPTLLVYIEEFLALKDYFKTQMESAATKEAKETTKKTYIQFCYNVKELARRGLKARIQLLVVCQMDYRDTDFLEAFNNITTGFALCLKPSAAQAAGFLNTELIFKNYTDNQVGTAVVTSPDVQDQILTPEYNLKQLLVEFSKKQAAEQKAKGNYNHNFQSKLAPVHIASPVVDAEQLSFLPAQTVKQPKFFAATTPATPVKVQEEPEGEVIINRSIPPIVKRYRDGNMDLSTAKWLIGQLGELSIDDQLALFDGIGPEVFVTKEEMPADETHGIYLMKSEQEPVALAVNAPVPLSSELQQVLDLRNAGMSVRDIALKLSTPTQIVTKDKVFRYVNDLKALGYILPPVNGER